MKKSFIMILLLGILFLSTSNVFAIVPTYPNNAKFNRGVSNMCYYVDSSIASHTGYINSALNNWVDTGYGWNPIYVTPVSSSYATHIDFYGMYEGSGNSIIGYGVLGYVSFWDINSNWIVEPPNQPERDYFYTELVYNLTEDYKPNIVFRHEIGHTFGLFHDDYNPYSIMYPNVDGMQINTVQKTDHDTINYLYN